MMTKKTMQKKANCCLKYSDMFKARGDDAGGVDNNNGDVGGVDNSDAGVEPLLQL